MIPSINTLFNMNKKYDYYLIRYDFKLVFKNPEKSPQNKTGIFDDKVLISWKNLLEDVINDFKNQGYSFDHIAEMNIITFANKLDMSYDFYIKHNMHAVEWKINAMMKKNQNLINKLDKKKCHPLIRNFSHVPFNK